MLDLLIFGIGWVLVLLLWLVCAVAVVVDVLRPPPVSVELAYMSSASER